MWCIAYASGYGITGDDRNTYIKLRRTGRGRGETAVIIGSDHHRN